MPQGAHPQPPILREKHFHEASAFEPESILRDSATKRLDRRFGACGLRPRPRWRHGATLDRAFGDALTLDEIATAIARYAGVPC